jgi:DnaJ-domain-containing protein 1
MVAFLFGTVVLLALLGMAFWFSQQKTEHAARMVRILLGSGALLAGVLITLRGSGVLGAPIGLFGLSLLGVAVRGRAAGGHSNTPTSANPRMDVEQAREILGVAAGASEAEIRQAHRELMKKLHPDVGGSSTLARQVQEARDVLLAALD